MSFGSNPSLRIAASTIGPEPGIGVLMTINPSVVFTRRTLRPFVPTE